MNKTFEEKCASYIGSTYNYLTILSLDAERSEATQHTYIKCQCKCGKIISIRLDNVIYGAQKAVDVLDTGMTNISGRHIVTGD